MEELSNNYNGHGGAIFLPYDPGESESFTAILNAQNDGGEFSNSEFRYIIPTELGKLKQFLLQKNYFFNI